MPMYRVLRPLSRKLETFIPKGTLTALEWLNDEQQAKLIQVGAVSRIAAPPLGTLPGWTRRGSRLGQVGIHTFDDFLERDDADIAELIGAKESTVSKWRAELVGLITVPEPRRRG